MFTKLYFNEIGLPQNSLESNIKVNEEICKLKKTEIQKKLATIRENAFRNQFDTDNSEKYM